MNAPDMAGEHEKDATSAGPAIRRRRREGVIVGTALDILRSGPAKKIRAFPPEVEQMWIVAS